MKNLEILFLLGLVAVFTVLPFTLLGAISISKGDVSGWAVVAVGVAPLLLTAVCIKYDNDNND